MKKQLLSRKRLTTLFYILCLMLSVNVGWGQTQTIGSFPYMEGGFENYAASTLTGTLSPTVWSVSSNNNSTVKAILSNAAVARTGSKYASHTTATTTVRLQSPTTATAANAPVPNTTHTVQYYYNTTTDQTLSLQGSTYNTAADSKSGLVTSTYSSGVWVKATYTATINAAAVVASANFAAVRHLLATTSNVLIDDFVVYAGAVDIIDPVGPTSPVVSGTNVSWTAAGDVDGGGYIVVRYASLPNADNDPNVNGIYGVGNTITNGTAALSGTVVYIGTGTSFTDTVLGSVSGSDYYKIYTVDKAFNYSKNDEIIGTAVPAGSPVITSTPTVPLTGFTFVQGSGPSAVKQTVISGSNLSSNIIVSLPTNYELSTDDFATGAAIGTIDLGLAGGTLSIRLKAGLSNGVYNENIVLTSGATVFNVPLTGFLLGSYLYNGSGSLTDAANWTPTPNVTGANGTFNLRTTVSTDAAWVLGLGSKVILGDSSVPAVTLTVASGFPITGIVDIPAASTGSNSLVLQDLGIPTFGALDDTSEVHLQGAGTYTTSATFGNLVVDGVSTVTLSGNPIIKKSLTVPSGSRLTFSGTSTLFTVINANASVVINGYLKIGKAAGAFSYNVLTPGSTFGSLQFKDAVPNLTLGSASTVEYARNNAGSTQSISILPSGINYAKLIISDGNPSVNCNKLFAGPITVNDTFTLNQGASTLTGGGFLTLADNATFVRTIGSLDVAPIFGSTVNVTYDGAAAISSGVEIPVATTVLKNLKIDTTASAVVTLTSATNLNNKLTVNAGSLATGGLLTLKSSECCTAYVAAVLSPEATPISGNVIAERYIPLGHRAYRLLSPVTTGGTINANWQEGGLVTSVGGISNPNLTYGTHITGAGGSANGFDTTTNNAASIFTYNNVSPAYTALANTSGTLTAGSPYLVYIRGSRLATNIDASLGNDATTLRTTGALFTGPVTVSGLNALANGFSIVGNPYQAQVDMNKVLVTNATAVNLASFYYVVDPKLGGKGAYATVDLVTPGNSTAVDANQYLQPGQACFVQTVAASAASLNFTEADKFEGTQTSVFRTKNGATARMLLTLNDASDKALDRLVVAFDANETNDVNQNDAFKLTNFDESMATSNTSKLLAIEKRAIPTDTDEIPLNITKYRGTSYSIKAEGTSLTGPSPYLFDQFANKTIEIPQDGSIDYAYTVDTAIPASIAADRFKLIYAKALKTIDNELAGFALYPNPSKSNSFSVAIPQSSGTASLTVSNMLGQQLYSQNDLQSGTTVKVTASNVKTSGVYLVSLTTEGKTATTKWIVE